MYWHFKIDNLSTVLNMVSQDCYMTSIDLADAYYTVPVLCMDQKYLLFQFEGNLCKYTCFQMASHQLQEYLPKYLGRLTIFKWEVHLMNTKIQHL